MNSMLVSVTERARDRLRMAVGARSRAILERFLIEAMSLSTAGGLVGVFAGAAVTFVVSTVAKWPILR